MCNVVPSNHFGPIPGVEVGTMWKFRVQVSGAIPFLKLIQKPADLVLIQASYFSCFCRISGFHILNFTKFQALIFKFSVFMLLKKGFFRL